MPIAKNPTRRQKAVFKDMVLSAKQGKHPDMKELMIKNGYSPTTALHPEQNLTSKPQWDYLKSTYLDDERALKTLYDLAGPENEDKDNRFKASVETLKLNDRYPATKSKILGLFDKISNLEE